MYNYVRAMQVYKNIEARLPTQPDTIRIVFCTGSQLTSNAFFKISVQILTQIFDVSPS